MITKVVREHSHHRCERHIAHLQLILFVVEDGTEAQIIRLGEL